MEEKERELEGLAAIISELQPLNIVVGGNVIRPAEFGPIITLPDGRSFYKFRRFKHYGQIYKVYFDRETIDVEYYNREGNIYKVVKKYAKSYSYDSRPAYRFKNGSNSRKVHVASASATLLRLVFLQTDGMSLFLSGKTEANHMATVCQSIEDYDKIYKLYYKYIDAKKYGTDSEFINDCENSSEDVYKQLRVQTHNLVIAPARMRVNTLDNLELCTPDENKRHYKLVSFLSTIQPDIYRMKLSVSVATKIIDNIKNSSIMNIVQSLSQIETPFFI